MHYLLFYEVGEEYLERRGQFRGEHLKLGWDASEAGELLIGGALSNPVDGTLLVFTSQDAAEKFVAADPYVKNGLIKSWRIREWTTVIGKDASTPVRPE